MNIKFIILFLFVNFSYGAYAGDQKGNGANFVVCNDQVDLLDFYEKPFPDFQWQGNETELAAYIINNFYQYSPLRFQNYLTLINNFYNEVRFIENAELGKINDAGNISVPIPDKCDLRQGVLQKIAVFGDDKKYLINKYLWEKLSVVHRAGVIIHEIIYRETQSPTSEKIRQFNNWLFSHFNKPYTSKDFYRAFKQTDFEDVELYGYPMSTQSLIIDDLPIRADFSSNGKTFSIFNQEVRSFNRKIENYPNGRQKYLFFTGEIFMEDAGDCFVICRTPLACKLYLDPNGKITHFSNVKIVGRLSCDKLPSKTSVLDK